MQLLENAPNDSTSRTVRSVSLRNQCSAGLEFINNNCQDIDECDLAPYTVSNDGICAVSEECTTWHAAQDECAAKG